MNRIKFPPCKAPSCPKRHLVAFGILTAVAIHGALAQENVEQTANGLRIELGQAQVELAAATDDALRLSVAAKGKLEVSKSTFLSPLPADAVSWSVIRKDGWVGVHTAKGDLLINPTNGVWSLRNAKGDVLIPPHALGWAQAKTPFGATTQESQVLSLGCREKAPVFVYGCGNNAIALQQTEGRSRVENGRATVPYYWSPGGYSVLAVSADDNAPARWEKAGDGKSLNWTFPGATANLYLLPAASMGEALAAYAHLSGASPVPPRWTFGYLQSRWGWKDRAYIEDTLKQFHDLKLPVDAFIFDFEWYTPKPDYEVPQEGLDKYPDFAWNPLLFPSPTEQLASYKKEGIHCVGIRKPRIGDRETLAMMHAKGWSLDGGQKEFKFQARDFDFRNADAREWYIQQTTAYLPTGATDGWWNDEGEGAFTTYYYWNLAQSEALARFQPGQRFWSINRAFSPGVQRLGAAMWTGDIPAKWDQLARTPTALLNLGLAGMPYGACDIGGFIGETEPRLLTRWMQAGVFFPIMRTHSTCKVTPHFPWLFGPEALQAIRRALELRYRLIPFYYSLAHETFTTGLPMMRPLVLEFPEAPKVANLSDEWIMGRSLLAAPILTPGNKRSVYLPDGKWYRWGQIQPLKGGRTINVAAALDEIPMYVRAGSILPLGPVIQHTSQLPGGPVEVQVYPGADARFTLVEDDGQTTGYRSGKVRRTMFYWNDAKGELSWKCEGPYAGDDVFRQIHAVLFDVNKKREMQSPLNALGTLQLRPGE